ncbi:hypothetical protein C2845_PM05G15460 [Panicum miliaceum]|uniref:Uncharacterized protein n=1 Tax=Panicum miliaceum TaxID=4540 RepID=A0A3L6T5K6_PANMI|nr:hypothetical protein C2845_PM05G15460 [Panicum miliaceum]
MTAAGRFLLQWEDRRGEGARDGDGTTAADMMNADRQPSARRPRYLQARGASGRRHGCGARAAEDGVHGG